MILASIHKHATLAYHETWWNGSRWMGTEIERKFLVSDESWRKKAGESTRYRQGYLSQIEECSVRIRVGAGKAHLNLKSATLDVSRAEFEYAVPLDEAEEILNQLCRRPLIEKTRYLVVHAGHEWEVDVFEGENAGLVVAEIELADAQQAFERPPWAGQEVSDDPRYYNVCLVGHPFKDW